MVIWKSHWFESPSSSVTLHVYYKMTLRDLFICIFSKKTALTAPQKKHNKTGTRASSGTGVAFTCCGKGGTFDCLFDISLFFFHEVSSFRTYYEIKLRDCANVKSPNAKISVFNVCGSTLLQSLAQTSQAVWENHSWTDKTSAFLYNILWILFHK